jgi:molybdopterin molybdotransferase
MISVEKAINIVIENAIDHGIEEVPYEKASGRILAEDVFADRAFPPFDRVCMDGIAIKSESFNLGHRNFNVEKVGAAGDPVVTLDDPLKCIEIMTGAPLPRNTDTVIRYEDLTPTENGFKVNIQVEKLKNIHFVGIDHKENELLLHYNTPLYASEIGVLATVGKAKVKVKKLPTIAVISSGEELVEVTQSPAPHQIRKSNIHVLMSRLEDYGIKADNYHFKDDSIDIVNQVRKLYYEYDVLMMSGGVSKGKFDFIPPVLENLRFEKLFHRVSQRPGKPFWFGRKKKKIVFAFPGNPVSSLACFHKYFIPWLQASLNQPYHQPIKAILKKDVSFAPDLTYFAQAKLTFTNSGKIEAEVIHGNGSGDMVNPTRTDGFLELPRGKNLFRAGEIFTFIPFKPLTP